MAGFQEYQPEQRESEGGALHLIDSTAQPGSPPPSHKHSSLFLSDDLPYSTCNKLWSHSETSSPKRRENAHFNSQRSPDPMPHQRRSSVRQPTHTFHSNSRAGSLMTLWRPNTLRMSSADKAKPRSLITN